MVHMKHDINHEYEYLFMFPSISLSSVYIQMVISDCRMAKIFLKVELRYALTSSGALGVMTPGILLMLM